MNTWQMAQQIQAALQAVTWGVGSDEVVFGTHGVFVFAGSPTEEQIPPDCPWCLVGIEPGENDDDAPDFLLQRFNLLYASEVAGDPLGEQAIMGGAAPDLGKSAGRGVAEVAARVFAAVGDLTGADGAKVLVSASSTGAPAPIGRGRHLVLGERTLECYCTEALAYAAPQVVRRTGANLAWEGSHCAARFDFLRYRVVQKAGTNPSSDPTDGTVVYTGTAAAAVGIVSAGNTYTVFADYSARGQAGPVVEGSSDPEVGAYVVAT